MTSQAVKFGTDLSDHPIPLGVKRRPTTWAIGARVQGLMYDQAEALALQNQCSISDIVRSALGEFLSKNAATPSVNPNNQFSAHQSPREAAINRGLTTHSSNPNRLSRTSQAHLNQNTASTQQTAVSPSTETMLQTPSPQPITTTSSSTNQQGSQSNPQSSRPKRQGIRDTIRSF